MAIHHMIFRSHISTTDRPATESLNVNSLSHDAIIFFVSKKCVINRRGTAAALSLSF